MTNEDWNTAYGTADRANRLRQRAARRGGPLSTLPERPSGRLHRTAPGRAAGRHGADRGHGQLPGEPPHGQVAADALDPARGRSAAPGPLRPLQRYARHRFRAAIPADQRPIPANGGGRLTPNFATVPTAPDQVADLPFFPCTEAVVHTWPSPSAC